MKWIGIIVALLMLGAVEGCQQNGAAGQKQQVTQHWNTMRCGVLYSMAKQQYEVGDFQKARKNADDALKLVPEHAPSLILSARISIELGQLEQADASIAQARKCDEKNAEAEYLGGVICQRWHKPQEALEFYSRASEKAPSELAYILARGEMLIALDRQAEALSLLEGKVAFFEHSGAIRDAVGQLLMQQGKWPAAAEMFRSASILSSDDDGVRERLGLALYYSKQYRDAEEVLGGLTKKEPYTSRADLWLALGECQLNRGQSRDARDSLETAARLNPASADIWMRLAKAAEAAGDHRRAEISLRKTLAMEPGNAQARLLLGYLKLRENKLQEALAAFTAASQADPRDTVSLCMVGYVHEKLHQPQRAMRCYAQALKIKPSDELAARLLAAVDVRE